MLNTTDILSTIDMIREQKLDIRTITMGISLLECIGSDTPRLPAPHPQACRPARKRFFLWKMGFSDAKTVPCPRCIFALPFLWKSGSKWSRALPGRKGCGPLELSWVF